MFSGHHRLRVITSPELILFCKLLQTIHTLMNDDLMFAAISSSILGAFQLFHFTLTSSVPFSFPSNWPSYLPNLLPHLLRTTRTHHAGWLRYCSLWLLIRGISDLILLNATLPRYTSCQRTIRTETKMTLQDTDSQSIRPHPFGSNAGESRCFIIYVVCTSMAPTPLSLSLGPLWRPIVWIVLRQ